jgi:hypothetical protein
MIGETVKDFVFWLSILMGFLASLFWLLSTLKYFSQKTVTDIDSVNAKDGDKAISIDGVITVELISRVNLFNGLAAGFTGAAIFLQSLVKIIEQCLLQS